MPDDRWQMTDEGWHMTYYGWQMTNDRWQMINKWDGNMTILNVYCKYCYIEYIVNCTGVLIPLILDLDKACRIVETIYIV